MANQHAGTGFSLADQLFNKSKVQYLGDLFRKADEGFDTAGFVRETMRQLTQLELKQRIVHIAATLERFLPEDYPSAARQIAATLPPPLDPQRTDDDFGDFIFAPLGEYVVRKGMAKRHVKLSLKTIKALTQRFSMEDAIRAFLNKHPEETLGELEKWSTDRNYHVRRLVSEGTRPLLPWSKRLTLAPTTTLPLLDILHADPTRYVTRSVSNHLNDIAKSDPDLVLRTLKQWKQSGEQTASELQWMNKHALRTLVKQGHPAALQFLGFQPHPRIDVANFDLNTTQVKAGQAIEFSFTLTARRDESLMIDYVIDFVKANGKHSPKVHKLKHIRLRKGESATVAKRHVLRAAATTYRLYPGTHHVTLQINGRPCGSRSFELA